MADQSLLALLKKIRDGEEAPSLLSDVRLLLEGEHRLDLPVEDLFCDDPIGDAEALLGVLELGPSLFSETLAAALRAEASSPEVSTPSDNPSVMIGDVMKSLFEEDGQTVLPVMVTPNRPGVAAELHRGSEPGTTVEIDVLGHVHATSERVSTSRESVPVLDTLGSEEPAAEALGADQVALPLVQSVALEAGPAPDVGLDQDVNGTPVAESVLAEAGRGQDHARPFDDAAVPVSDAVANEGGQAPEVLEAFEVDGVRLMDAVAFMAGPSPDVSRAVIAVLETAGAAVAQESATAPEAERSVVPSAVPVGLAVRAEAGRVEVAEEVHERLFDEASLPLAHAVAELAGAAPVADAVMSVLGIEERALPEGWLAGLLDHELDAQTHVLAARQVAETPSLAAGLTAFADAGRMVREGVMHGAGDPPALWHGVAEAIGIDNPDEVTGWEPAVLREAVWSEAGQVEVAGSVMALLLAPRHPIASDEPTEVVPANDMSWSALIGVMAAAALLFLWVPSMFAPEPTEEFVPVVSQFAVTGEAFLEEVTAPGGTKVYVDFTSGEGQPAAIYLSNEGSP
jgi:hypothetical protein